MIDWNFAERIAEYVAGEPPRGPQPTNPADLAKRCEALAGEYTGLVPARALPAPEMLGRGAWTRANLRSMRPMLDPLSENLASGLGPLQPAARGVAGYVLAAEMGVLVGLLAHRVLGQYEAMLLDPDAPPRLLLVAPNLDDAVGALDADAEDLFTWVMLHEVTHALQFSGVPWLRGHVAGLIRLLLSSLEVSVNLREALRMPTADDLRGLVDLVRQGDLMTLVTTPEQRELIDGIQATMAVIEGHAEHVMDAVGASVIPSLPALRDAMERRRDRGSPAAKLLQRLLGLELKLRQYRDGKRFCDAVVAEGGIATLNRVWSAPSALPTLEELAAPNAWIERTSVPSVTK
jgi:coenzyme F420 biosynthesis associated uncharacterized protein